MLRHPAFRTPSFWGRGSALGVYPIRTMRKTTSDPALDKQQGGFCTSAAPPPSFRGVRSTNPESIRRSGCEAASVSDLQGIQAANNHQNRGYGFRVRAKAHLGMTNADVARTQPCR